MRRKSDKKYLLTLGTCLGLLIVMIISLYNKKTYNACIAGGLGYENCCKVSDSYTDNISYTSEAFSKAACQKYATNNQFKYYECQAKSTEDNIYTWNITTYQECTE